MRGRLLRKVLTMRYLVEPWEHLEVVFKHVVAPIEIVLNGLMTCAHISGLNPTTISFKFSSPRFIAQVVGQHVLYPPHPSSIPSKGTCWPIVIRLEWQMALEIEVHSSGLQDASTLAKSQIIGISDLQVVGYTLWLEWKPIDLIPCIPIIHSAQTHTHTHISRRKKKCMLFLKF